MESLYLTNKTNTHRYALGSDEGSVLYVFGVNPSQATNLRLDSTVSNVKRFAELIGFDNFVMLNISSQRATDPKDMSFRKNSKQHKENLAIIDRLVKNNSTIWAAWGNLIENRNYLRDYFFDIAKLFHKKSVSWIKYDDFTKLGHPKHPARKKREDRFTAFDLESYIQFLGEL
jgi:hypothetical protein